MDCNNTKDLTRKYFLVRSFFVEICDYFVDIIPYIGYNKDVERR